MPIRRFRRLAVDAIRRPVRTFGRIVFCLAAFAVLWVAAYRWIDPPATYLIVSEWRRLGDVEREWRRLDTISPHLARAAMGGEDARFCDHWGFDIESIKQALDEDGRRRGASTITQQVAKNVFLWPDPSWTRKGLEAGFAVLIEALWPKARTMEVYLNVAEMGAGVFGAEAAAAHWFGKNASRLTLSEAARIAAILPNPRGRHAARPSAYVSTRAAAIAEGAQTLKATGGDRCLNFPEETAAPAGRAGRSAAG